MAVRIPTWRKVLGNALRETAQQIDMAGARLLGKYAYQDQICRHKRIMSLGDKQPKIAEGVWIAPSAHVIGNVSIGSKSSIWYGSVLRGDVNEIKVGSGTSIGDRVIIHVASGKGASEKALPTTVGSKVLIEAGAILHACQLEDECKIEAGSIIFDGAVIGKHSIIGAGSMVPQGKQIPSGELWEGRPAKFVRKLTEAEIRKIISTADTFITLSTLHDEAVSMTPQQRFHAEMVHEYNPPYTRIEVPPASELQHK
jgi:carbonic anhydrase/acetyltransferase-like protein (isoleucine patch superfamily)